MSVPSGVQADFPLSRLTTVRTGGHADFFARPGNEGELLAVLAKILFEEPPRLPPAAGRSRTRARRR